jgi:hypothetical protein
MQIGLFKRDFSLLFTTHFVGWRMYFFMTGAAVPTIEQFFGQLRAGSRTRCAWHQFQRASKSTVSRMLPIFGLSPK